MTTIAYKNGIIAYDSRASKGSLIIDDEYDKHREKKGHNFFFSGNPSDFDLLISIYFAEVEQSDLIPDCEALVVDEQNDIWDITSNDDGYINKYKIDKNKTISIGSGQLHAFTAMDMGCTAYEAVEMAVKRDIYTGGKINIFEIIYEERE